MSLPRPQSPPVKEELRKKHERFLNADIDDLIEQLSVEEKIHLLGAPNWWNTTPVDRLDIPAVRMRLAFLLFPVTERPPVRFLKGN